MTTAAVAPVASTTTTTTTPATPAIAIVPTATPAYGFDLVKAFESFTGGAEKDPAKLVIPGAERMGTDERRLYAYVASCLAPDPAVGIAWRKRHAMMTREVGYWRWSALSYLPLVATTPDGVAEAEAETRAMLDALRLRVELREMRKVLVRLSTAVETGVALAAAVISARAMEAPEGHPGRRLAEFAAEAAARVTPPAPVAAPAAPVAPVATTTTTTTTPAAQPAVAAAPAP